MTSTTKEAWAEVGDRIEALALKIKLHAAEERGTDDSEPVATVFERLADAINDAFAAVQDAVHDPAVKEDVREAVRATGRAVTSSAELVRQRAIDATPKKPE